MKNSRFHQALGQIDEQLVASAMERPRKRKLLPALAAAAACICLAAGIWSVWPQNGGNRALIILPQGNEYCYVFPWEYLTESERYREVVFDGQSYSIKNARPMDEWSQAELLGTGRGCGTDVYTGTEYTCDFPIYAIGDISPQYLVAVKMEDGFYVYYTRALTAPETFGAFLDAYALAHNVRLERFGDCSGYDVLGNYALCDDAQIWQILQGCREAAWQQMEAFFCRDRQYISFSVTSAALGAYKQVMYVSADGYIATNVMEYGWQYYIGEAAAQQIISYAMQNSVKAEPEAYQLMQAGIVTEITQAYVLVDDTILCERASDGRIYRVALEDVRISRWFSGGQVKVGDAVIVTYEGEITQQGEIVGARSIQKGIVSDDAVRIPE